MRGTFPRHWLAAVRRIGRRRALIAAAALAALAVGVCVDRLARPRLHIASGTLFVQPDPDSQGRPPAVIRDRMGAFLGAQRVLLVSDEVLIPAVMKLDRVPTDASGDPSDRLGYSQARRAKFAAEEAGRIGRLRDAICVETATSADGASATIYVTVAWPQGAAPKADEKTGPAAKAAGNSGEFTYNVLMAYRVRRLKIRTWRELDSPAARAVRQAEGELVKARKALESFLSNLPAEQAVAIAGGGWAGLDRLVADGRTKLRELDDRLKDRRTLSRAIEVELAWLGKDPKRPARVPPEATAAAPGVAQAAEAIAACEVKINSLAARGAEAAKPLAQAHAELAGHRRTLTSALREHAEGLKTTIAQLQVRLTEAAATVDADRKRLASLAAGVARFRMLNEDLAAARDARQRARADEPAARRAEGRDRVRFEIIVQHTPGRPDPAHPYRPIRWRSFLLGLLAAGVVAGGCWMWIARRGFPAAGPDPLHEIAEADVLASIPRVRSGKPIQTE